MQDLMTTLSAASTPPGARDSTTAALLAATEASRPIQAALAEMDPQDAAAYW
jgi:hypothetical protein